MSTILRLYRDVAAAGSGPPVELPPAPRAVYAVAGTVKVASAGQAATLAANSGWFGTGRASLGAGSAGGEALRWELAAAGSPPTPVADDRRSSSLVHEAALDLDPEAAYLLRCDRVDFPPGGVAYLHTHRGPGIRCLLHGALRVETRGAAHPIDPGAAWFEAGADPVYAAAAADRETAFVRVMILPAMLRGQSSIRYVRPEDQAKPKAQRYQVFVDEPIDLPR